MAEHVFETLSSWLYNLPQTDHLGEREDQSNRGHSENWFRFSRHAGQAVPAKEDPKQMVVVVRREKGDHAVAVLVTWLNMSGPDPIRGEQSLRVSTYMASEPEVKLAVESLSLRVLDIFKDVLEGTGVAGPLDMRAPKHEETDPEFEHDLARSDEEVGRE